jgi:tartrate dehydrogenase/decarboxylase / D-malate dehydrogenase
MDEMSAPDSHPHDASYRIGYLPGDGVGPEVLQEARRAVDATGVAVEWVDLPWGTDYWLQHGRMMPVDGVEQIRSLDAVLMGAIGDPRVPDHISLWGLVLELRQKLDLWANLRPVRLLPGIVSPLARANQTATIDMIAVRENTEGEYAGIGGRAHAGLHTELAVDTGVFTRHTIERLVRFSFDLARGRHCILTSATKSNASRHGYVLWDEIAADIAEEYPDVEYQRVLVDALAARMIERPESLDVIVASNLFADILTDIGAAIQGGLGMAASSNIAPDQPTPGVYEPVHGSAPNIAGRGIANPAGAIWSAALMLRDLGERSCADTIMQALEDTCRHGPRTPDVGGTGTTAGVGDALTERISSVVGARS